MNVLSKLICLLGIVCEGATDRSSELPAPNQGSAISIAAIQLGPNLLRRDDQLFRFRARGLVAALRFDRVDEGGEGAAGGAIVVHVRVHQRGFIIPPWKR